VVRKGGSEREAAWSVFVLGDGRGDLFGLGVAPGALGGVRLDLAQLSLEVRAGYGNSFAESARFGIRTQEFALGAAGFRGFDLGPVTLAIGVAVSSVLLAQDFHDPQTPNRNAVGVSLGPLVSVQVPVYQSFYARLDGAVLTYLFEQGDYTSQFATPFTGQVALGLGSFF
jgi:hypothetical protein